MRHGNRWARLLAAVCAMALFLSVISPALAAKYPYDTISMDDVNMRSRANTTSTILKKNPEGGYRDHSGRYGQLLPRGI